MANARREAKEREGGEAAKVFELEGEAAEATVVRLAQCVSFFLPASDRYRS